MVTLTTEDTVKEFIDHLEMTRRFADEIWIEFGHEGDKQAEAVSYLVALALGLSRDQVAWMEEIRGIPVASLTAAQKSLLAHTEPLFRDLGFLGRARPRGLGESRIEVQASGHMQFRWEPDVGCWGLGINWLPHSLYDPLRQGSLVCFQAGWRGRAEWLIRRHYVDFRQAADCWRLLFQLALTLSPEQIEGMVEQHSLQWSALRSEQQALIAAAGRLYSTEVPNDLDGYAVWFERGGQFWLRQVNGTCTPDYGMAWLPHSWR